MSELREVWDKVKVLLKQGFSVIPVRDKDDGKHKRKSSIVNWEPYQTQIISEAELFDHLEKNNSTAIAVVCGAVSGNLEVIDIDVKYKPGCDATLFSDMLAMYPDLFRRLRAHKSPSGGFHLLYRIKDHKPEGNQTLASRPATEEELKTDKRKIYTFLETRGEKGYILFPPSLGYSVYTDVDIPVITWEERSTIIQLCRSFNEIVAQEKPVKPTKDEQNFYDDTPWDQFDNTADPIQLLEGYGWKFLRHNAQYIYFNRPDAKNSKGVDGSFIKSARVFTIFTTSTGLEPDHSYKLTSILAHYDFNGDRRAAVRYLIDQGFGRIKPQREKQLVKLGKPLPANASTEAKEAQVVFHATQKETYPYGTFWDYTEKRTVFIQREALYNVSAGLGYRWYDERLWKIKGIFVHEVKNMRTFFDELKGYIREEDAELYLEICDAFESFVENHGKFSASRIELLDDTQLVNDTNNTAYKFYNNGYLFITEEEIRFNEYSTITGLVLASDVQPRNFTLAPKDFDWFEARYIKFLDLAIQLYKQSDYVKPIIGYLAHRFKDDTTGYIVTLTESVQNPEHGGGSGKNVFCSLFSNTTTFLNIPASQSRPDERFLQPWSFERILCISDLPKDFDFLFLKEISTGSGILKKLFKDQITIGPERMPKLIVQTNYSFDVKDGGLKRRIVPIEFTDFFTNSNGVDGYFGIHFPKGWTAEDWMVYDNFTASCVKSWLGKRGKLKAGTLSESGWEKQFEIIHGALSRQFIAENIDKWLQESVVLSSDFVKSYDDFCRENSVDVRFKKSMQSLSKACEFYCRRHGIDFINNQQLKVNGINQKVKVFHTGNDAPF
jgi:hypothetical protein